MMDSELDYIYRRTSHEDVDRALDQLPVAPSVTFQEFYRCHRGPFGSDTTGHCLLDLVAQDTNIQTQTAETREAFGLADRYLVISDLLGNAVLVYDCESDAVYDVDFEGGDQDLAEGRLAPTWATFADFLRYYFGWGQ